MSHLPPPLKRLGASAAVTHNSVRIWIRLVDAANYRLQLCPEDGGGLIELNLPPAERASDYTQVVAYPQVSPRDEPLRAATRYRYRVIAIAGGEPHIEGAFETAPAPGVVPQGPFAFAVMSCHQPFTAHGEQDAKSLRMLAALPDVLEREHVKRVLMVGDQMYTDLPVSYSLFNSEYFQSVAPAGRSHILDCSAAEVRELLHERYRRSWGVSYFDDVQRSWPCYMVPDDHEFIDNWGSLPEHDGPRWRAFAEGAWQACYDYELARVLGPDREGYHYTLEYGPIATFVMDLRSQKRTERSGHTVMFADQQLQALRAYLEARRDAPVFMLVLSVPLFHLPDRVGRIGAALLGEGSDVHDRWSAPGSRHARAQLVKVLTEHMQRNPRQKMVLLGGDVHVSLATRLHWRHVPQPAYQLTASPLSNNEGTLKLKLAGLLARLKADLESEEKGGVSRVRRLAGVAGRTRNPLAALNVGIVAFEAAARGLQLVFKLYTFERRCPGKGRLVYCSEPIPCD